MKMGWSGADGEGEGALKSAWQLQVLSECSMHFGRAGRRTRTGLWLANLQLWSLHLGSGPLDCS